MGMGHAAAYADVISTEGLKELCPREYGTLLRYLEKYDVNLDLLAQGVSTEEFAYLDKLYDSVPTNVKNDEAWVEARIQHILKLLQALCDAFSTTTNDGTCHLELELGYHDSQDEGDRYDDVDGAFWAVGGMYAMTSAGERIKDYVERKHYVVFG
jgi:hypothetical protein